MTDFSHLKKLEITGNRTARFTIYQLEDRPTLILASATEDNKPFFNSLLKRSRRTSQQIRAGGVNPAVVKENREEDKGLYPLHVVKGWESVNDTKGKAVPFTTDNVKAFLEALPDWIFDEVRVFAGNPNNFVDEENELDVGGAAKN